MRKIIASGLLLAAMAGTALAQTAPAVPASPAPAASASRMMPPPPPPPGPGAMADAPDAPPPPPGGPGARRPPPPPSKAAHFRLERGDTALDVKCADDESMKSCADIALQMLDKLQTLPAPSASKP